MNSLEKMSSKETLPKALSRLESRCRRGNLFLNFGFILMIVALFYSFSSHENSSWLAFLFICMFMLLMLSFPLKQKRILISCVIRNNEIVYWVRQGIPPNPSSSWAHQRDMPHRLLLRNGDCLDVDVSVCDLENFTLWMKQHHPSAQWAEYYTPFESGLAD